MLSLLAEGWRMLHIHACMQLCICLAPTLQSNAMLWCFDLHIYASQSTWMVLQVLHNIPTTRTLLLLILTVYKQGAACACLSSLSLWHISNATLTQAQHDADAAELAQALRAAACVAILALSPSERAPHQVDCLACLTKSLQVASLLLHHMLHHVLHHMLHHMLHPMLHQTQSSNAACCNIS